jgi:hypothetical protein
MAGRKHTLHTETLASLAHVSNVVDFLDGLSTRLGHAKSGRASRRNYLFTVEAMSPLLVRLDRHVDRAKKLQAEVARVARHGRPLMAGPRGPLP